MRRRHLGFVFQFFNLIPVLTVAENAALPLTLDGTAQASAKAKAAEWIEKVGLDGKLNSRPDQLSGGQQQRVAVARALVTEPALILADEPTGNLDTKSADEIADLLKQAADEWGRAVVMVTHDVRIAAHARRIVFMRDGAIVDDVSSRMAIPMVDRARSDGEGRPAVNVSATLAWRYLIGRPGRTVLTTLAITLGVALIFGLNGMMPGLADVFTKTLFAAAGQVDLTVSSESGGNFDPTIADKVGERAGHRGRHAVTAPVGRDAQRQPGQRRHARRASTRARLAKVHTFNLVVGTAAQRGRRRARSSSAPTRPQTLGSARRIDDEDPDRGGHRVLHGRRAARERVVALGARGVRDACRCAAHDSASGNTISTVEARFAPGSTARRSRLPCGASSARDYVVGGLSNESSLLASVQTANYMFTFFGLFALIMGGFIILNTFRTLVAERRHDIGMLRAIGADRRTILGIFLIQSVLQGVLGTAVGIAAGYLLTLLALSLVHTVSARASCTSTRRLRPSYTPGTWIAAIVLGHRRHRAERGDSGAAGGAHHAARGAASADRRGRGAPAQQLGRTSAGRC